MPPHAHQLLDFDDEEITARHQPDPALLLKSRQPLQAVSASAENSGISVVRRAPPPPPSQRARLRVMPLERLVALRDMFIGYVGPAGRPLLLQAISQMGVLPEQFPSVLSIELIGRLAASLDDPVARQQFHNEARALLQKEG